MIQRRTALTVAVLLLVVLAGCSSGGPATTTDAGQTEATTTAATSPTATGAPTTATVTVTEADVDASRVQQDAVAAMGAVDAYRMTGLVERRTAGDGVNRSVSIRSRAAFDRTARRMQVNQSISGPAGTAEVSAYLVDRSLYQRSDVFVPQYGTEWVFRDVSANFSRVWRSQDTMTRQRALLENGTPVSVVRTALDGTDAYALRIDADESALNDDLTRRLGSASNVTITDASFVVWVATDDARPLFSRTVVNSTATLQGGSVTVGQVLTVNYDTRDVPVSISLPPGADDAVSLANATAGTGARVETPPLDAGE